MIVTLTRPLPNTGDLIQAHDIADPITDILAVLNGGVDSDNLAANSVGTSELVDGSVTEGKLAASYFLGWNTSGLVAPTTITYNGNRNYDLVFNSVDYTQELSEGMRLKLVRSTTTPTQSTSLNGTTQYWSKSSPASTTFTDDFCAGAYVYLTSYPTAECAIISRYNGTSGWSLRVATDGRIVLAGNNGSAANSSYVLSNQALPLNKWVSVSAQLDMSAFTATTTTSYMMLDGLDVPCVVQRSGTNPTALVQAGNLEVGTLNAGAAFFPGKIAQAWYSNAKITQANARTLVGQALTPALITANSIVSAYSFNGVATDLNTTTANDLSAVASASYTSDGPFANGSGSYDTVGTTEYAIITKKPVFSTNTTINVQVPSGGALPTSGGISTVAYSTQAKPYGFPSDRAKWAVEAIMRTSVTQNAPVTSTWYNLGGMRLTVPPGSWLTQVKGIVYSDRGALGPIGASVSLSKSTSAEDEKLTGFSGYQGNDTGFILPYEVHHPVDNTSATTYYKIVRTTQTSPANLQDGAGDATSLIRAFPNFL